MIYCYKQSQTVMNASPAGYVAKQQQDSAGVFWKLYGVFPHGKEGFAFREAVVAADSIEEIRVWCDIHGIDVHHEELLAESYWQIGKTVNRSIAK